jgi:hypothetical protein
LTEGTIVVMGFDCGSGYDSCNIGENVAHGSVEDETVDRLVEGLGSKEGDGNEAASCQGQNWSNSLERAEGGQLRHSDIFGLHGDGFAESELQAEKGFQGYKINVYKVEIDKESGLGRELVLRSNRRGDVDLGRVDGGVKTLCCLATWGVDVEEEKRREGVEKSDGEGESEVVKARQDVVLEQAGWILAAVARC